MISIKVRGGVRCKESIKGVYIYIYISNQIEYHVYSWSALVKGVENERVIIKYHFNIVLQTFIDNEATQHGKLDFKF